MSVRGAAAWSAVFVAAGCSSPSEFTCTSDEACSREGVTGVCQSSGYCSFPDDSCPSRQRYVEHAAEELLEACVDSSWGLHGFVIGAQNDTDGLSFHGVIDEVGLWSRALQEAEMAALGNKP